MKVSVLIPIYKVQDYIEKCARSVLEQTYANLEIIFVNDCTPDDSLKVLNKTINEYPQRREQIKIISHSKNIGLYGARRTAIKASTGMYIYHLDGDDYIEPETISSFISIAIIKKLPDIIIGNYIHVYTTHRKENIREVYDTKEAYLCKILRKEESCNIWNNLIKRELYDNIVIPDINVGEDYIQIATLLYYANSIEFNAKITYNYTHLNSSAFQFNKFTISDINDREKAELYLSSFFKDKNEEYIRSIEYSRLIRIYHQIFYTQSKRQLQLLHAKIIDVRTFKGLKIKYVIILALLKLKQYQLLRLLTLLIRKIRHYGNL